MENKLGLILPYCEDCQQRKDNLLNLINHFENINSLYEGDDIIKYVVVEQENNKPFHKTKLINIGAKILNNYKYIGWHDVDVRFKPTAYENSLKLLKENAFVKPFNGKFFDIIGFDYSAGYTYPPDYLKREILHNDSPGGAMFFRSDDFNKIGGMNEKMISWGYEDDEFLVRIAKYGYNIKKLNYICAHIHHPRGQNSSSKNPYIQNNFDELNKIISMSLDQLKEYTWLKK